MRIPRRKSAGTDRPPGGLLLPVARGDQLVVEELDDELLLYDRAAGRVHALNATAAAVWRACEGTRDVSAIAACTAMSAEAVEAALEQLVELDLVAGYTVPVAGDVSRRTALRRVAIAGAGAAVALPVIRSIAAPVAEASGSRSTCPVPGPGSPCTIYYGTDSTCTQESFDSCVNNYGATCSCQVTTACALLAGSPVFIRSGTCA